MGLFTQLVVLGLPFLPRSAVWVVARNYVAGSELEDALERVASFRADGFGTILDVLGEGEGSRDAAKAAAAEYERAIAALSGVDPEAPVSVKPTHLGLLIDRDLCRGLLADLCLQAAEAGRRVRFEMEDAPTIDETLAVFSSLRGDHSNLGCVLQARLFRTEADVRRLLADGPDLDVRLVKGIYLEPASIAWTEDSDITRSYAELAGLLVEGNARVAFATHDDVLADHCAELVSQAGWTAAAVGERRYEFQLLMGVRRREADRLLAAGHRVRIYVPYGSDWHQYSLRRLKHNPQVATHVIRAFFGRR